MHAEEIEPDPVTATGWERWWPAVKPYLTGVVTLLVIVGIRLVQLRDYPKGERHMSMAPNEQARAYVGMYTDKGFFGKTYIYYRVYAEKMLPDGKWLAIQEESVEDEYVQAKLDMTQLDKIIKWSDDSMVVLFSLGATKIRVDIPL